MVPRDGVKGPFLNDPVDPWGRSHWIIWGCPLGTSHGIIFQRYEACVIFPDDKNKSAFLARFRLVISGSGTKPDKC